MPSFAETIRMAMRLDPEIFALVQASRQGVIVALAVMLLASISEAVGQSIVLFLNRVRPWRFVLAQVIAVLSNVIAYVLWALVIWGVIWLVFGVREPLVATLAVVGLAYAPQLFAFFEMTPWLGNTFGVFLSLWSMAAVVVALQGGMGLSMTEAALTGLASWVLIQLFRRSLGRPIYALGRYIQRGASGSPMTFSMSDLYEGNLNREDFSASVRHYSSTSVDGASVDAPSTNSLTTNALTTNALTTDALTTDALTTDAPTTDAPTTDAPTHQPTDAPGGDDAFSG